MPSKSHNPERQSWKGVSHKKGRQSVKALREKDMDKFIKEFTDGELQAELAERRAQAIRVKREQQQQRSLSIVKNISALLELVPMHGRTSCSDDNPVNEMRSRCTRCVLLAAQRDGAMYDSELLIEVRPVTEAEDV